MNTKFFWRNIVWALVIFILCSVPGDNLPKTSFITIPHFDKIAHFGMFFVMGIFLFAELSYQTKLKRIPIILIVLFLIAAYGGFIEYLQQNFFSHRSGDYWDLMADVMGGLFAVLLYPWLKKKKDLLVNSKPFQKISFLKKIL